MYGALFGDLVGSIYEHNNVKSKSFQMLSDESRFTDDSVMTIAVAESIMNYFEYDNGTDTFSDRNDEENLASRFQVGMRKWGLRYPEAGYGSRFLVWLRTGGEPYNSWGNGSAMRVSPVAWLFNDLVSVRKAARISAFVTHNHPEGIKGAEAIASAVYMARTGIYKPEIKKYIEKEFGYDLDRTCDEIRPEYTFDVSCQGSVPEAIIAFLEGRDIIDVVRNAVSLGGDSDTVAAMAASIAEAYYGMDYRIKCVVRRNLNDDQKAVLKRFEEIAPARLDPDGNDPVRTSRWRVLMLPDYEQEVAEHFVKIRNRKKTAEAFGISEQDVSAIIQKAERYTDRLYRENIGIEDYINELSPVKFTGGEGRKLKIACGTWIRDDDQIVIDMISASDRKLSVEEMSTMTGIPERRIKFTLSMLSRQRKMYEERRSGYLNEEIKAEHYE